MKITSIDSKEAVHFQYKKKDEATKSFTLKTGDSLSIISDAFEGITISAIDKTSVEFSNGIVKTSGEELDVDIYMTSYQEQMLRLALQRHFETEKENFCNRRYKIKTLALFFIDDITSYRISDDGKKTYLLTTFETLLKEQIQKQSLLWMSMMWNIKNILKQVLKILVLVMLDTFHKIIVILTKILQRRLM